MNWKLVFLLSLLGLAHAIVFIGGLSDRLSAFTWLLIWAICAVVISRHAPGHHFWHGFGVGFMNWVWVTLSHVVLFDTYVAHHPGRPPQRGPRRCPHCR